MFIIGLGTAAPSTRYTQKECWEALRTSDEYFRLSERARALLRKVLMGPSGIQTRYLALEPLTQAFDLRPDALHSRFSRHAPDLACRSAERALASTGLEHQQIDALLVSTCTGYLCPGLTSYIVERLGLRSDLLALDLVGQGCGAALPNLRTAASLLASGNCEKVLSICVEVCSAAFYLDDDPGVLISACLFGDGAAAAVLSREAHPTRRRVAWTASGSVMRPEDRDYLRFEQRNGMLRNILARQVPDLAAKHAETVLKEVLGPRDLRTSQITTWILHAGGRDVLAAIQQRLDLSPQATRLSASVFSEYGNLSSPFVLFVLRSALDGNLPGGWWWMASFGAGFSSHGALLEVT